MLQMGSSPPSNLGSRRLGRHECGKPEGVPTRLMASLARLLAQRLDHAGTHTDTFALPRGTTRLTIAVAGRLWEVFDG
jgi:hypothetical protein